MYSIRRSCQSALRNSNGSVARGNVSCRAFSRTVARSKGMQPSPTVHEQPALTASRSPRIPRALFSRTLSAPRHNQRQGPPARAPDQESAEACLQAKLARKAGDRARRSHHWRCYPSSRIHRSQQATGQAAQPHRSHFQGQDN